MLFTKLPLPPFQCALIKPQTHFEDGPIRNLVVPSRAPLNVLTTGPRLRIWYPLPVLRHTTFHVGRVCKVPERRDYGEVEVPVEVVMQRP